MDVSLVTLDPALPDDLRCLVRNALGAVLALAARAAHSSRDSNSLGGIVYSRGECRNPDLTKIRENIYLVK